MDVVLFKIVYTSLLLAILFSGYVIVSGLTSTVYNEIGFYIYLVIHASNIIGSILSSFVVYRLMGVKWTIIVGGMTYIIWLGTYNFHMTALILCTSFLVGIGGGFMRTQQSVWISSMPIHNKPSYYIGIFNAIFGLYGIIGSLTATIIFVVDIQFRTLIWILTGTTSLTVILLMMFMPNISLDDSHIVSFNMYYSLIKRKSLWLFVPLTIFQSISLIYTSVVMPLLIMDNNFMLVSLNFTIYSLTYCLNSYLLANIYKKTGAFYLLIINIVIAAIVFILNVLVYIYPHYIMIYNYYPILIIGFFCGINDSTINSITITETAKWFGDFKSIFSFNRAIYSLFSSIFSLVAFYVQWYVYMIIMLASLIFATICYGLFRYTMRHYDVNIHETTDSLSLTGVTDMTAIHVEKIPLLSSNIGTY